MPPTLPPLIPDSARSKKDLPPRSPPKSILKPSSSQTSTRNILPPTVTLKKRTTIINLCGDDEEDQIDNGPAPSNVDHRSSSMTDVFSDQFKANLFMKMTQNNGISLVSDEATLDINELSAPPKVMMKVRTPTAPKARSDSNQMLLVPGSVGLLSRNLSGHK